MMGTSLTPPLRTPQAIRSKLSTAVRARNRRGTKPAGELPGADLANLISGYLDHLQDQAYVSGVVSRAPMAELGRTLASMLRSGERQAATDAALFAQDAVMFGFSPAFARYFPRSPVLRALRENLSAADYFTRHQSIKTLGRVGPRSNARHLAAAFPWFLERDPLNLDDLLGELFWLARRARREPYLDAIVTAPLYLARWAILGHLLDHGTYAYPGWVNGRPSGHVLGYVERLARDPHPWVCAEATWRLSQLEASDALAAHATSGMDTNSEPSPTFFTLWLQVGNYLWIFGRRDYDVQLVERIAAYVVEHPPYSGMNIDAYWAEFGSYPG
jgi:hypothetical protein